MSSSSSPENDPGTIAAAAATWQRVVSLLDEALDLPPEERAAFLDAACDEAWLREEVESLLEAHEDADALFETPAVDQARTLLGSLEGRAGVEEDLAAGQRVGPYRIARSLGRGGMGVVYLAERADGTFEKAVALKVIKRGMDTDEVVRRFRYERQILARLDHPHIARLYDGGVTDDGRPYFVMERVEGRPIDRYCDEERLRVGARLQLFATVCEAVQYAHQNLVVHRDLKPSNILVTADGEVRLLDFGIAKLVDADGGEAVPLTRAGHQALTPEYAAPEQLTGAGITTATDVYALGVVLYQLLVGRRPYQIESRALTDIERIVREEAPPWPSTAVNGAEDAGRQRSTTPDQLRRRLRGDLDAIVMKALEKEPERRYQSAGELVEDLRRYRARLPVRARRDVYGYYAMSYRFGKFVRRNKATVAAVLVTLVTLAGGLATTLWQARIAAQERDQKQLEAAQKQLALEYVIGTFDDLSPEQAQGYTFTGEDVVQSGLRRLEGLRGQPQLEAQIASVLGRISFSLGEWEQADSLLQAALALQEETGAPLLMRAETKEVLGNVVQYGQLDHPEAERLYREALAIKEKQHGPRSPELVSTLNGLGQALYAQGDSTEKMAEAVYRRAIALGQAQENTDLEQLAESLNGLADLLAAQQQHEEAEQHYREALSIRRRVLGTSHPHTASTIFSLARLVEMQERPAEAIDLHREALRIYRSAYGAAHPHVGGSLYQLARLLQQRSTYEEAEEAYEEAVRIFEQVLPDNHLWNAYSSIALGQVRLQRDKPAQAEAPLRRGLSIYRTLLSEDDQRFVSAQALLGASLAQTAAYDEAAPLLRASYDAMRRRATGGKEMVRVLQHLILVHEAQGEEEAAARYRTALQEHQDAAAEGSDR